jgi:NADH-quinone oxidoreductase subunit L
LDTKTIAIWIVLMPLLSAAGVGLIGLRGLRSRSHWLVLAGVGSALVLALSLFSTVRSGGGDGGGHGAAATIPIYEWFNPGDGASWFNVSFRIDPLTSVMLLTVLSVSFLVVMYSVGYMRDHHGHAERGYERFFAFLGLFVFSMCTLVLGGNFLVLYVGWELVGLSSYLLIGFYYQKPEAALAARKAFIVNRVGDFGFGLGILLIYLTFGTLEYDTVFSLVEAGRTGAGNEPLGAGRLTAIALLLFCGAVGKSAQLPLHVWLPDAMEGPTPVSALIHAATMVTAGVYMVARCSVIFASSSVAMLVVACIGAVTALFAATIALTQFDMKRILAYSTLSQLGYMFLGLGVGAFDSAIFHLFTHAFFKALLFLGAGSVMHAMAGVIDIRRFSGLARGMKITAITFWIGGLALAGFPLLAGFWSKDEIVHAALYGSTPWLGWVALVTALLTAFYTFRMIFMAFHGPERLPRGVEHAHESGPWMTIPLVVLSVGAIFAGYAGVTFASGGFLGVFEPHGAFHTFLHPVFGAAQLKLAAGHAEAAHAGGHALMSWSAVISAVGIVSAAYVYLRQPVLAHVTSVSAGPLYRLFFNKYFVDEAYGRVIVRPLWSLGGLCYAIDRFVINGILALIRMIPQAIGLALRGLQQGSLQGYATAMVVGAIAIVLWVLVAA